MRTLMAWVGLALALALLLAVNMLSHSLFQRHRIDLTENQQYTLTQGSKNIIAALDEPVTLRFYLSEALATRLPAISPYANQVKELLQEYARQSNGQIRLVTIDPEPFTEAEDEAVAYGLQGLPINSEELFYFGLVGTGATDEQQVISFFTPERQAQIEYDLSKLIYQLTNNKKLTIGLLTSLAMEGASSSGASSLMPAENRPPWVIMEQLKQLFNVVKLDVRASSIPDEVDILLVALPDTPEEPMSKLMLYAIDQFIISGGNALIFMDALAEVANNGPIPALENGVQHALSPLINTWGVALTPGVIAADIQRALQVQTQQSGRSVVTEYPVWMSLLPSEMEQTDIVTAEINQLTLLTPGVIEIKAVEQVTVTPLLRTTGQGAVIDQSKVGMNQDPQSLLNDYQPAEAPLILAARISGALPSFFADGPPEGVENLNHLDVAKDSNVILVADVDLLHDRAWVQVQNIFGSRLAIPNAGNGAFVINAVENLVGNSDLISVRSRGLVARPFTLIQAIRQKAEADFRQTEQTLLAQLEQTEAKLLELQEVDRAGKQLLLNQAQLDEVDQFRQQKIAVRQNLRDVRHALRQDIERVEQISKVVNMGVLPLLVAFMGVVLMTLRLRRQRRA